MYEPKDSLGLISFREGNIQFEERVSSSLKIRVHPNPRLKTAVEEYPNRCPTTRFSFISTSNVT